MKRFTHSLMFIALAALTPLAAPVTPTEALHIAGHFARATGGTLHQATAPRLSLAHQGLSRDGMPDYYVFNQNKDDGFIIVAGDDRLEPVCGYSSNGAFNPDDLPAALTAWLADLQRQVQFLRDHPTAQPLTTPRLNTSVAPMLTTRWHQCRPFNDMCPEAPSSDDPHLIFGGRACTGCAATSTAQVMNYYQWPERGTGSISYSTYVTFYNPDLPYSDSRPVTLSADFSQSVYQWELMRDVYLYADKDSHGYLDENGHVVIHIIDDHGDTIPDPDGMYGNAVARLMSDVGISVRMNYGADASSSATGYIKLAMEQYFGYKTEYRFRDEYQGDWDAALRNDLNAGHPVIFSGYGYAGGHAFVLDGYDAQGRFHVNWGWAGKYDGYYLSSALNPSEYDFNYYQESITIVPDRPDYLQGDIDGDGKVTISDVTALIDIILQGTGAEHPRADVDGDGEVRISDVTTAIDLLLGSGN